MRGREPSQLMAGTRMGDWRVLALHESGTFGVVYLAVRVGEEAAGPCALKLARSRADARLAREVELLARVHHPHVPRLRGHGDWHGFPYVVMEWVAGVDLYRWARLGNPSRQQVTRLLAKLAGALSAVHEVGGQHRDMKGANVLVRLADGEPMLMDFGAGTWTGAAPLTVGGPPGTPLYYSPERLRAHLSLLPPDAPSGAGPADDVYGLGVTAFRLLTDRYPFLDLDEAERTQARLRGLLPLAPHELNPGVPQELSALVLRMMAPRPEERPSAHEVARSLEAMVQAPEETWEDLLFAWETESTLQMPGRRHQSRVAYELLLAEARVGEVARQVAAEVERAHAEQRTPIPLEAEQPPPRQTSTPERREAPVQLPIEHKPGATPPRRAWARLSWLAVAGCALLAVHAWWPEHRTSFGEFAEEGQQTQDDGKEDGGAVGLGDATLSTPASVAAHERARRDIALELPKKPLPGQRRPPCKKPTVEIHGGCWGPIDEAPPCGDQAYAWKDRCYWPFMGPQPPATSDP
ncbi:serine/threonine-protein kinase [Hyalangium rubrum]|uniref:Serine/threonine-protein kinase n=1 Tax=Hyalangium rubrum TaxID=3103134 RepID=A0ABU5HEV5_9BACT|nr:serine/threonine-protein kinase [Hyalangium sp. s54d21]MDY7231781.1 serine/threonine-protein kinase [Hyalangium sp. s54d21]